MTKPSGRAPASLGDFLCPPEFAGPQGVRALVREGSLGLEVVRGRRRHSTDRRTRRAAPYARAGRLVAGEPVLLVPGFMAGDWSLAAMARALREHGYRTYRAGIHVNAGCTLESAARLEARLEEIAQRRGRPVTIVGHSLGGMLARGLATQRPDLIAGIVTMGSPVLAPGAVHGLLGWNTRMLTRLTAAGLGGLMGADCVRGECARESWTQARGPLAPEIGFTALYSRRDGVVDWRSCLDPAAEHVEVHSSHCGMAVDPEVLDAVLTALHGQRVARVDRAARTAADALGARRPRVRQLAAKGRVSAGA